VIPPAGPPAWEVFVRARRGTSHVHVGTVHAADAELALQSARDLYTRRSEGVSLWLVPTSAICASQPDDADSLFEPAADKLYRHASHHPLPADVDHM
jgi:ring-1,2-phenylacetyl-CoA epoxidase subunit PaaB